MHTGSARCMSTLCAEAARVFCARSFCFTADGTPLHIRLDDGQFYFYTEQVRHLATTPPTSIRSQVRHLITTPPHCLFLPPLPDRARHQHYAPRLLTTSPHEGWHPCSTQWQDSRPAVRHLSSCSGSPHYLSPPRLAPLLTQARHLSSPPALTSSHRLALPPISAFPRLIFAPRRGLPSPL